MNANKLPDLDNYDKSRKVKPVPKDTLNKMGIDTSDKKEMQEKKVPEKKEPLKSAQNKNRRTAQRQLAALLPGKEDDEHQ